MPNWLPRLLTVEGSQARTFFSKKVPDTKLAYLTNFTALYGNATVIMANGSRVLDINQS